MPKPVPTLCGFHSRRFLARFAVCVHSFSVRTRISSKLAHHAHVPWLPQKPSPPFSRRKLFSFIYVCEFPILRRRAFCLLRLSVKLTPGSIIFAGFRITLLHCTVPRCVSWLQSQERSTAAARKPEGVRIIALAGTPARQSHSLLGCGNRPDCRSGFRAGRLHGNRGSFGGLGRWAEADVMIEPCVVWLASTNDSLLFGQTEAM